MDGWTDTRRWMDGRMGAVEPIDRLMDGWMDKRIRDGSMGEWIDGSMDGYTDGWNDG